MSLRANLRWGVNSSWDITPPDPNNLSPFCRYGFHFFSFIGFVCLFFLFPLCHRERSPPYFSTYALLLELDFEPSSFQAGLLMHTFLGLEIHTLLFSSPLLTHGTLTESICLQGIPLFLHSSLFALYSALKHRLLRFIVLLFLESDCSVVLEW